MVLLGRALVRSYRLSIATMLLTEAVWPQFTMQVFGGADSTPIWVNGGVIGDPNWCHRVEVGQPYLPVQSSDSSFSVRRTVLPQYIHYRQQTDRSL